MEKCSLSPNVYMALHSLVAEYRLDSGREYTLKVLISRICGFSNCYCKSCEQISDEFYDVDHYETKQVDMRKEDNKYIIKANWIIAILGAVIITVILIIKQDKPIMRLNDFYFGYFSCLITFMIYQDLNGKELYIKKVNDYWMDTSPWFWVVAYLIRLFWWIFLNLKNNKREQ